MALSINRLDNGNVYTDGNSLLGKVQEVTLPEMKAKMSEHNGLGMIGQVELPTGFEKMEMSIKWTSYYPDVLAKNANIFAAQQLQIRSTLNVYGAGGRLEELPVVVHVTATPKGSQMGTMKAQEQIETETAYNVTYIKCVVDGEELFELDVLTNVYKVSGSDVLAQYRINLGI